LGLPKRKCPNFLHYIFLGKKTSPGVRSSERKIPPKDRSALDSYLKKREAKLKGHSKTESDGKIVLKNELAD
jgi:hypothetical protein